MAIADERPPLSDGKVWGLFKMPFRSSNTSAHPSNTTSSYISSSNNVDHDGSNGHSQNSSSVSSVARSLLPTRRRLRLDPRNKLYFPYEPGKQVQSAIRIKNTSKSHVAFKFQTTAPKSCFMRPPGAILAPGESLIATGKSTNVFISMGAVLFLGWREYPVHQIFDDIEVFKFVEPPENNEKPLDQKRKVKFKIMSLKVKGVMDYVPELFDEQKDQVAVEQILQVVFLDVERPSPALEKLKRQLAEAEAALESRKKPPEDTGPKIIGDGLVIDEWKERRERYLARQQVEGVDSV